MTICPTDMGAASSATALRRRTLDPVLRRGPANLPCWRHDPDLWFAETPALLESAKQLCTGCPARAACLAGAIGRREPWGVWGGEIFERGRIIPRKRPRGRPRKNDRPT
jgi:WhiB family redox-sensing transcriptional regulator